MSKQIDNGGPAFPHSINATDTSGYHGMSLRDWFAGQALAGLCNGAHGYSANNTASEAYTVAEAMLAARKEKP